MIPGTWMDTFKLVRTFHQRWYWKRLVHQSHDSCKSRVETTSVCWSPSSHRWGHQRPVPYKSSLKVIRKMMSVLTSPSLIHTLALM